MTKEAVIFDLDGTLSDRRHRLFYLDGKKNWEGFFNAMDKDPPIKAVFEKLFYHLEQNHKIFIVTGRPQHYKDKTVTWLKKHNVKSSSYEIFMRESKNYESDLSLKKRIYEDFLIDLNIIKVYEDQPDLIKLWKEYGLEVVDCSLD